MTVTVDPSVTPTTPTTPASPVTSAAPGAPPCPTRYLSAKIGHSGAAAGSVYTDIEFTNISNTTCTLYGYPGVVLAGGSPVSPIGQSAAEDPGTPRRLVTLAPGAVASATYLQIIPPNQTTPIFLPYQATACATRINILTIDVTKPGPGTA